MNILQIEWPTELLPDGLFLLLAGAVIAAGWYFFRKKIHKQQQELERERQLAQERQHAHEVMKKNKELYQFLTDNAQDMISRHRADGTIQYVSPSCRSLLGYEPDEMIGHKPEEFIPSDDLFGVWECIQAAVAGRKNNYRAQHRMRHHGGFWVWVETNGGLFYDQAGNLVEIHCIVRDITQRRQVEEELHSSRQMLALILNSIPQSIFWKDRESIYQGCNEVFARAVGLEHPEQVIGKTDYDLPWAHMEVEDYRAADQEIVKGGNPQKHAIRLLQQADGRQSWIDISKVPLFDSRGKASGVLGIYEDCTERLRMEETLRESEKRNRRLFETMPHGVVYQDAQGHIIEANPAAEKILGLSLDQLQQRTSIDPMWRSIHEDGTDFPGVEHPSMVALRTGEEVHNAIMGVFIPQQNRIGWIKVDAVPLFKVGESVPHQVYTTFEDITERRVAVKALRESEERYRQVIQSSPMGMHMYELQESDRLIFLGANPAADQILGIENSKFIGMTIEEAFPPLISTEVPLRYRRAAADGISWQTEEVIYEHGAIKGAYEVFAFQAGKNRVTAMFLDITKRKQTEEEKNKAVQALLESERKFKELAELLPETIYESDRDGRITFANQIALKKYGYSQEDLDRGLNVMETLAFADREKAKENLSKLMRGGILPPREYTALRRDGSTFPIIIYSSTIVSQGQIEGLRGIIVDITEQKQAEEERLKLDRQMQQAQKLESLGVLAGGIAHDFNNILTSILGNASLALEELPPLTPGRENLEGIEEAARRAADLCRQMLAYSGKGRFVIERLNLNDLIDGLVHLLKTSISKKAALNLHLEKGLPPVSGDATQMRQVIMNLVINASEAIGEQNGFVTVATGMMECSSEYLRSCWFHEPTLEPGYYIWLEVSDTGCGMNAEVQRRIFEPFFTTKFTGRGLGLSAVLGIVRGHNGALQVESQLGKGTTFRLLFPAVQADAVLVRKESTQSDHWKGKGRVLLVDDEQDVRTLGQKMLERLGFEVAVAANGFEALEIYKQRPGQFVLVLLDLTMPYLNGEETFRELCQIDPQVKVILSSGYSESEVASRFAGERLAGFIQKPYSLQELRQRLREVLKI